MFQGPTQNPDFENLQESVPTNLQNPYLDTRTIEDDVCYYLKPPATAQLNIKVNIIAERLTFDGLSSNVRFRFWFNPSEYFQQKGFIPLLRVPSFFEK